MDHLQKNTMEFPPLSGLEALYRAHHVPEVPFKEILRALSRQRGLPFQEDKAVRTLQEKASEDETLRLLLGECYFYGCGTAQDLSAAEDCFLSLSQENGRALWYLGRCALARQEEPAAAAYFEKAAALGDPDALYEMGLCCLYGRGTAQDEAEGVRYLCEAVRRRQDKALLLLGLCCLCEKGITRGELEESEDGALFYGLGSCYLEGIGCEKDPQKAVGFLERACQLGETGAARPLGQFYFGRAEASAPDSGDRFALYREARYYLQLSATEYRSPGEAVDWMFIGFCCNKLGDASGAEEAFRLALDRLDDPIWAGELDVDYWKGRICLDLGGKKLRDVGQAFSHLERSAMKGNPTSMAYLSGFYLCGAHTEENPARAVELLQKAYDKSPFARLQMGYCCQFGLGMPRDEARAARIYEELLHRRDEIDTSEVFTALGTLYLMGKGVPQDIQKAKDLLRQGDAVGALWLKAAHRDPDALCALGKAYGINHILGPIRRDVTLARALLEHGCALSDSPGHTDALIRDYLRVDSRRKYRKALALSAKASPLVRGRLLFWKKHPDYQEAFRCFDLGLSGDDAKWCMFHLGLCYLGGYGVQKDAAAAQEWFDRCQETDPDDETLQNWCRLLPALAALSGQEGSPARMEELCPSEDAFTAMVREIYRAFPTPQSAEKLFAMALGKLGFLYLPHPTGTAVRWALLYVKCRRQARKTGASHTEEEIRSLRQELSRAMDALGMKDALLQEKEERIALLQEQMEDRSSLRERLEHLDEKMEKIGESTRRIEESMGEILSFAQGRLSGALSSAKAPLLLQEEPSDEMIADFVARLSRYINCGTHNAGAIVEKEEQYLTELFGSAWGKLLPESRTSLVSASVLWKSCASIENVSFDYSGICISSTSALENEIGRWFFTGFQNYLTTAYGPPDAEHWEETYANWPEELLSLSRWDFEHRLRRTGKPPLLTKKQFFTLGSLSFLMGARQGARCSEEQLALLQSRMEEYLSTVVREEYRKNARLAFVEKENGESVLDRCETIRREYRNKAAHTAVVSRSQAEGCYHAVIGRIDAYDHTAQVTGALLELFSILK